MGPMKKWASMEGESEAYEIAEHTTGTECCGWEPPESQEEALDLSNELRPLKKTRGTGAAIKGLNYRSEK